MRRRYSHNKPIEPIRIQNQFSYSKPNETTDSDERVAIRSPVRSPDNDNDDMDFQYDHKDDLSFQDINDDDNAYGSINPQDYNDEMIFSQDNVNSSDTEEEEESDNEYNYEEEEEEEDNNENNDEEEEDEGNNDDNNNQVEEERNNDEEERNYDEEERNNEEEEIHQIVEALDEDKIPFCNGQFAPYFDNYTTTALFCWLQKHNVSTKAYEDLVDIIHNSQFEPTHVLRIQKILEYSDLPGNLKGLPRQRRSITGEVWLQDEPFLIIMTSQILEKVTILMMFQHQNIPDGSLRISEIIYKCNDRWHVRNVKLSYLHPSDYISIRNPPSSSTPIYKLFLDLYYDDFEMKELEKGKVMTVQGQDAWIIAGLGVVTADLPQGNDMTGVLRHNANKGCRTCKTTKESLSAHNQNIVTTLRYHHITDEEILKISYETIMSRRDQLCTEYGLRSLPREDNFIEIWKNFEIPKRWSRLPNPITHYNSFMMSDLLRLAMIMPFLLNQFLKESSIKRNETAMIQQRIDAFRVSSVPKIIISCWIHVAKTMKAVFNKKFTSDSYEELQQCLEEEFSILPKV
ncbi:uncharacterized protein OCT59_018087 [Rhizophagus irregularis]|uniref:uncharacterized protein n=1 Tax=Rhizophagus irregularis TaxID=588596 RepID=UPI003333715A|nr:hypothetical protein OCT59_018087 [Rhizophagus irregularis]